MPTEKGRSDVRRFLAGLPADIEAKLGRGAARVFATVIADEAKARLGTKSATLASGEKVLIASSVKVRTSKSNGVIKGSVQTRGPGAYVTRWLEWGTSPHFITVDDAYSEGRTVGRINRLDKAAAKEGRSGPSETLIINGKPVGKSVYHPGADPEPFLRISFDYRQNDALAAAQAYVASRVVRGAIVGSPESDEGGDE